MQRTRLPRTRILVAGVRDTTFYRVRGRGDDDVRAGSSTIRLSVSGARAQCYATVCTRGRDVMPWDRGHYRNYERISLRAASVHPATPEHAPFRIYYSIILLLYCTHILYHDRILMVPIILLCWSLTRGDR